MESKSFVMYYAESIRGSSGVNTTPDEEKTPEGIKQAIDRHNAVLLGGDHDPYQFNIIRRVRTQTRTDDGRLLSRSVFENAIEVYPAEPCNVPRYYVKPYDHKRNGFEVLYSTFDPVKAVEYCRRNPDSYVEDRHGRIIYKNDTVAKRIVHRQLKEMGIID